MIKQKNKGRSLMNNKKIQVIYKDVDELIPYINNPRLNDNAVDAVASSIKNFGFKNPILIDKINEIINGHTRLTAAKKLGLKMIELKDKNGQLLYTKIEK